MTLKIYLLLFVFGIIFIGCSKEVKQVDVEYQLDATVPTGDHFYVNYITAKGDTVVEHEHYGWKYSFKATKPFNAYLRAEVNPIDAYEFTIRILVDGKIVQQQTASTVSAGIKVISISQQVN
jgi:hypothetical protein